MTEVVRILLSAAVSVLEADADLARRCRAVLGPSPLPDFPHKGNCALFGITPRVFEDAARRGEFPAFKVGRHVVARRVDLEAWIQSRPVAPTPKAPPAATPRDEARAAVRAAAARIQDGASDGH